MSESRDTDLDQASALPGAAVVRSIRRLLAWSLVAALVYGAVMTGGQSGCAGGLDGSGGFIGADGEPTDVEPMCWSLTLQPSPLVYGALIFTVIWAINRVLHRAETEAEAERILGRAALVVVAITLGSLAIGQTWFWLLPVEQWAEGGSLFFPFPFASVESTLEPISSR